MFYINRRMCSNRFDKSYRAKKLQIEKKNVDFLNVCLWVKIFWQYTRLSCTILTCTNTAIHCFWRWTNVRMITRRSAVNKLPATHRAWLQFFSWLVLFHALQYLCFLCMTVYIYMFGSLSPVIDFAELEINYQTSILLSLSFIFSLLIQNDNFIGNTHETLYSVWVLMEFNNIFRNLMT